MSWNEREHPRDGEGRFSRLHVDAWARQVSDAWGKHFDDRALRYEASQGNHPEGHTEAADRLHELRQQATHTPVERAEMRDLEDAFAAYRQRLGMEAVPGTDQWHRLPGGSNRHLYDEYGDLAHEGAYTTNAPLAAKLRFQRVGDHPQREGRVGTVTGSYMTPSTHPLAGGLWVDPANPGTRHDPRYVNDAGHRVTGLRPASHRSEQHKGRMRGRRSGELTGRPQGAEPNFRIRKGTRGIDVEGERRFGYGTRADSDAAEAGRAQAFVALMKRRQPRARQETARQPVRRTPRGTKIEDWMRG